MKPDTDKNIRLFVTGALEYTVIYKDVKRHGIIVIIKNTVTQRNSWIINEIVSVSKSRVEVKNNALYDGDYQHLVLDPNTEWYYNYRTCQTLAPNVSAGNSKDCEKELICKSTNVCVYRCLQQNLF